MRFPHWTIISGDLYNRGLPANINIISIVTKLFGWKGGDIQDVLVLET